MFHFELSNRLAYRYPNQVGKDSSVYIKLPFTDKYIYIFKKLT